MIDVQQHCVHQAGRICTMEPAAGCADDKKPPAQHHLTSALLISVLHHRHREWHRAAFGAILRRQG
jgi:hypothetical protein